MTKETQTPIHPKCRPMAGFSLIELLVVLAIMSVLASIAIPLTELAHRQTQEEELRTALRQIRAGLDQYKSMVDQGRIIRDAGGSGYPSKLRDLVDGVPDALSAQRTKLYFLRRIPRDPFSSQPELPAEETWAVRSYDSPPAEPREGKDVFDVYSRSDRVGLNGRPYKTW